MMKIFLMLLLLQASFVEIAYAKKLQKKSTPLISSQYIEDAISEAALRVGVPTHLLKAVCSVESALRPHSFVFNDGGASNHAFGLCQVLRKTAEEQLGRSLKGCVEDFSLHNKEERTFAKCELFGPKTNAYVAALVLKSKIDRYEGHMIKGTAAYNSGSVRYCGPSGWATTSSGKKLYRCEKGDLMNREYVNRVTEALAPHTFEGMSKDAVYKG